MTVNLQILPESAKPVEVEKIRSYCTECGTRSRSSSWKFCPSCGSKM
jgi:rRNA maturation endonuclease Nob1